MIFSEAELITAEAFWNSFYHSWFSPETTLNIPEFCVFQFLSSQDFFCNFSPRKPRYYAFWKIRSYSSTSNFPRETSDLTLSGTLDLIPFWQNLNFSQEFSPGNLRSDASRDKQPCSVLFQICFSLKQRCSGLFSSVSALFSAGQNSSHFDLKS